MNMIIEFVNMSRKGAWAMMLTGGLKVNQSVGWNEGMNKPCTNDRKITYILFHTHPSNKK